jgi:hypothetical protein
LVARHCLAIKSEIAIEPSRAADATVRSSVVSRSARVAPPRRPVLQGRAGCDKLT